MVPRPPIVTLLTDFGTADTYAGQMKGVIAAICPAALVIDLTHAVRPQAVEEGAFLLESALAAFPAGTVHVAVVDPGVGTDRLGLAIRSAHPEGGRFFIGPDNGLLSCALPLDRRPATEERIRRSPGEPARVALPEGVEAVAIDPGDAPVSPVFHGRDVFAVAAARIAAGVPLTALGAPVRQVLALPPFRATAAGPGRLLGRIVHIDRFGNAVTTVHVSQLAAPPNAVETGGVRVSRVVRTYAEGADLVALVGSSGFLEVAEVNGNAAARLGLSLGDPVVVETAAPPAG